MNRAVVNKVYRHECDKKPKTRSKNIFVMLLIRYGSQMCQECSVGNTDWVNSLKCSSCINTVDLKIQSISF